MDMEVLPDTLAEVRQAIDALDSQLIGLLARRQQLVAQAGRLKPKHDANRLRRQACRPMWQKPCGRP